MNQTERRLPCTCEEVFAVLADGWLYATWVVGASRIRDVDASWPAQGARIHHSVGSWPLLIDDYTEALLSEPPRLLRLRARTWPVGEATVTITLEANGPGTVVRIDEDITAGPARLVPTPLRHSFLRARNRETLLRLEMLAVGQAAR